MFVSCAYMCRCRRAACCAVPSCAVLCCAARCVVLTVLCNSLLSTPILGKVKLQVCNEQLTVLVKDFTQEVLDQL